MLGEGIQIYFYSEVLSVFFEVKHKDKINRNQAIVFPLIEEICGVHVKIARIVESSNI